MNLEDEAPVLLNKSTETKLYASIYRPDRQLTQQERVDMSKYIDITFRQYEENWNNPPG